jgi:hypothetical protein
MGDPYDPWTRAPPGEGLPYGQKKTIGSSGPTRSSVETPSSNEADEANDAYDAEPQVFHMRGLGDNVKDADDPMPIDDTPPEEDPEVDEGTVQHPGKAMWGS